jgi:DNA end-binding protein Ku
MPSPAWKGFISFGLVSIPIRLYPAARGSRIVLHQLHKKSKTRLRQPLFCPTCNRIVDRSEVVKGYEFEKGQYTILTAEDIKQINPASARVMEILAFVNESEIDPLYFESSYFVVPEAEGRKAYQLLLKAMQDTKRVGIAKVTMHQREHTVFLRPYHSGIALHTMYFANEIRQAPGFGETENVKIAPQEIKLAEQLVENLSEHFDLSKYHDEFEERLQALLEAKQKGREITPVRAPARAPVIDMMAALKKSLEKSGTARKGSAAARPASAHARREPRRAAS